MWRSEVISDDLVPFVQSKKREKHPWKSVSFSEVPGGLLLN